MGMMGRLTERDRELIGRAIEGIATSDVGQIQDVVMALGEFREKPDQSCLYDDISNLLSQYGTMDLGEIDVAEVMMSLMEVMKENKIIMPHGLTMLASCLLYTSRGIVFGCGSGRLRGKCDGESSSVRTYRSESSSKFQKESGGIYGGYPKWKVQSVEKYYI